MPAINIIKLRRGPAATWTSANPTLADGEIGVETDTGAQKMGDGSTPWASLAYLLGAAAIADAQTTAFAAVGGGPLQLYDNFQRSNRNLLYDVPPNGPGYAYGVDDDVNATGLSISGGLMVRTNTGGSHFGNGGAPILVAGLTSTPSVVGIEWVFTAGSTSAQNAVIGCMANSFASGSIQLAVTPGGWSLFLFLVSTETLLASGSFSIPLSQDGATRYRAVIRVDIPTSTAVFQVPAGDGTTNVQTQTLTASQLATYWGTYMGVQVRLVAVSDGDVKISQIAAA